MSTCLVFSFPLLAAQTLFMVCHSNPHLKEDGSERGFFHPKMSVLIHGLSNKRRIQSSFTLCFTDSCLLFCCLRKREKTNQPNSNTWFLFSPKAQTLKLLAFNFSSLLLNRKSITCVSRILATNLLHSYKQCHYRNFCRP